MYQNYFILFKKYIIRTNASKCIYNIKPAVYVPCKAYTKKYIQHYQTPDFSADS